MKYVTVYTVQVRRRKTKRLETVGCVYKTKTLTPAHARIRERHPEAQTWKDPTRVIQDFISGMNLGQLPIVHGGERIA